jgi:hypothetical protein
MFTIRLFPFNPFIDLNDCNNLWDTPWMGKANSTNAISKSRSFEDVHVLLKQGKRQESQKMGLIQS